ncbi:MAG: MmcQ/YjbR family DNA-binding protein [Alphaproteobacteria bacterium]|nr:MmcQ/YjbR family DNA-binding protein [Alphaproteobacteria bacterium]
MSDTFQHALTQRLRAHALTLPEVSEGSSCVNRAFKIRGKKNFLFLGEPKGKLRVMLKLGPSEHEVEDMQLPGLSLGSSGWATFLCEPNDVPPAELLEALVVESYRALAPKTLVKQLDG